MTPHRATNWAMAALIAATATLGPVIMDGPTDIQAIQDTADSVRDAQQSAQTAAQQAAHPTQLAQVQP